MHFNFPKVVCFIYPFLPPDADAPIELQVPSYADAAKKREAAENGEEGGESEEDEAANDPVIDINSETYLNLPTVLCCF